MWRIHVPSAFSLRNLRCVAQRSSRNTVRLYHAHSGCFGYRPMPQITLKGKPIIFIIDFWNLHVRGCLEDIDTTAPSILAQFDNF